MSEFKKNNVRLITLEWSTNTIQPNCTNLR